MKQLLFVALALVFTLSICTAVFYNTSDKVDKTEIVQTSITKPEVKEAYKLDNAEFKSMVADSGPSFGTALMFTGLFSIILGLVLLAEDIWRRDKQRVIGAAVIALIAFLAPSIQESGIVTASFFPAVLFYRDKDGGEGNGNELPKEVKEALTELSKKNGEAITEAVKKEMNLLSKTLITQEGFKETLKALGVEDGVIKNMNEVVTKHGNEINKLVKREGNDRIVKSIDEIVAENAEAIQKMASADKGDRFKLRIKADVQKTIVNMATNVDSTMGYRVPGMGQIATRNLVMDKIFTTVSLNEAEVAESNGVVRYMDVENETNNAAETAESAAKPEAAIDWKERSADFRVIANTIPVTRQAYRRLGFVASEIDRLLRKNHALRKDLQLWSGDGIAPNIKGIYTYTTAATLANLPNYQGLVDANLYDLIANLRVYVANKSDSTGAQSKYNPNVVLMNPADVLKYKLAKAADGHYILPPFISADGKVIDGCTVIETPVVTANTMALGDSSYPTIYQSEDVVIEMGFINDQFTKNQWTIRAEQELLLLVRNADLGAFTKITDINAAIEALQKP
jgi:hypothetical protein